MEAQGPGSEIVEPALRLLSTAIAIILEDSHDAALAGRMPERFDTLESVGEDVAVLARAARILLTRLPDD